MKALLILLGIVGILAGGAAYYATYLSADPPPTYRTVTVTRGDLVSTIDATGTIEPEEVIDVGAQVTGRIEKLGRDPHDLSKDGRLGHRGRGGHCAGHDRPGPLPGPV